MIRIPIINQELCKPKKCNNECQRKCPVNQTQKKCIEVEEVAKIANNLCIGCGMCEKVCPFHAIKMVNIPSQVQHNILHSYGENQFRFYKLPIPKKSQVYGIIGQNGTGKSTLLNILCSRIKPNFGEFTSKLSVSDIIRKVRGTELQNYFQKLYDQPTSGLRVKVKPQNVELLRKQIVKRDPNAIVKDLVDKVVDPNRLDINYMGLEKILDNHVVTLSGGEMQLLACFIILQQDVDVYIFDEFTNFLDVEQRLKVADAIRNLVAPDKYIFIVDHDLSVLDYTTDIVSIVYGEPSGYGIISLPHATGDAINMFFNGYIPSENMKFRSQKFTFRETFTLSEEQSTSQLSISYDSANIEYPNFQLHVGDGTIPSMCPMVLLMGKNGSGKTTYLNHLAENLGYIVSYKKQYVSVQELCSTTYGGSTVRELLYHSIKSAMCSEQFRSEVLKPLNIEQLYNRKPDDLSGGEQQRLAIVLCLGCPANIYLLDEPSASLDIEYRVIVTKVLKRFFVNQRKIGFIVEHDIMMAMSLGMENSRIVIFSETERSSANFPEIRTFIASQPMLFNEGIQQFLKSVNVTFRSDSRFSRPRINKKDSQKDREQKSENKYFV